MNTLFKSIGQKYQHRRNSQSLLPALFNKYQVKNQKLVFFNTRSKSTHKKWLGRLEYLNRDPTVQSKSNEGNDIKRKERNLNKNNRVYLWGNGELGALGQLGFLHPKAGKNVVSRMRRPFVNSLSNFCDVRSVSCGYGFTLGGTNHKEK